MNTPALLLDAGNSRLKPAIYAGDRIQAGSAAAWRDTDLVSFLSSTWRLAKAPVQILCANVAGAQFADRLTTACQTLWQINPGFAMVSDYAAGVRNRYTRLDQLGIDRWLAAVAGYNRAMGPVCVVDCGTAVTAEFVTRRGDYLGGVIAPGALLMFRALAFGTAELAAPVLDLAREFGDDTASSINAGIMHALSGFIDQVTRTARATLGDDVAWIITGGDAVMLGGLTDVAFVSAEHLVLEGLALLTKD